MRNKYLLMFASMAFIGFTADAQTVGISSSAFTPNSASILDVSSTTKGVLLPRMTTAERGTYTTNSSLGATHKGITIFNTTTNRYDYWDGTSWLQLAAVGAAGSDFIQNQTAASQTANFRISGVGIHGNGSAGAPTMTFEGSQTTGLFRPAADQIGFSTAATQRAVIDASGNLGIGTASPGSQLHTTGTVRFANYTSGIVGVDASGNLLTRTLSTTGTGVTITNGNAVSGNPNVALNYANSSTGGAYPQGNFGQFENHGTYTDFNTQPGYWGWNYVAGNTNAPNATASQWYRGVYSLGAQYPARGVNGYSLELAYPRDNHATAGVWMRTVDNGTIGSWTRIDAGSNNTNFIWNQNASAQTTGNFWISGTGSTNGTLTGGGSTVISSDNIQVNDLGAGARFAYIDLEGDDTYTDYGLRLIRGNGGVNATSTLTHRGTGDLQIHTNEAAALTFHTTNAERMRIQAGGNVGVNSNAPSNRLYVNDVAATMNSVNTYQFGVGLSGATNLTLGADASFGLIQSWASKPLLINSQGNNVGIGMTTAPAQRLDVNGGIRSIDYGAAGSVNVMIGDDTYFTDIDVGNMVGLYSASNNAVGGLRFGNTAGAYLYGATDNIGVGTTTPNQKLQVAGIVNANSGYNYNNVAVIYNSSTDVYGNIRVLSSQSTLNDGMYLNYNSTGGAAADLRFYANGTSERMRVLASSGNVGIATAAPSYKLHVVGDIYANGGWMRVSGNQGFYFESWGGGWFMSDATWVRSYNSKNVYTPGTMQADASMQSSVFNFGLWDIVDPGAVDGQLFRTGGQGVLEVDDWFYVRDNDNNNRIRFNTDAGRIECGPGAFNGNAELYGGYITGNSTSDGHRLLPNGNAPGTTGWGYVGQANTDWYYMYSDNYTNTSRREKKRDITPLDENMVAYVMEDIRKMKPSFYKYKTETDEYVEGYETKFRPNLHLGLILDESPDYIQDQAFSGIDIYAVGVMALTGVKYHEERLDELSAKVNEGMTVGSGQMAGNSHMVSFPVGFDTRGQIPVVNITPTSMNTGYYVSNVTEKGFVVNGQTPFSFNWQAVALNPIGMSESQGVSARSIDPKLKQQLEVDESKKQLIKQYWKGETEKLQKETQNSIEEMKVSHPEMYKSIIEENKRAEELLKSEGRPAPFSRNTSESSKANIQGYQYPDGIDPTAGKGNMPSVAPYKGD